LGGAIGVAGQTDCYRLDAVGGHHLLMRVVPTGGNLVPNTEIWNPNGTTLCGPSTEIEQRCRFTATGTHTILVRDLVGPNTGGYALYIQDLNAPQLCVPVLVGDPPASGEIAVAADGDCFTFNGIGQSWVRVEVAETGGTLDAKVDIVPASGVTLCGPTTAAVIDCKLSTTGPYTVVIRDNAGTNTGTYTFSVNNL
jgi:hypothetical protein